MSAEGSPDRSRPAARRLAPAEASDVTRVFVVDDHALFAAGVRAELADRFTISGEAADVDEAIAGIRHAAPDVVLLDVHLPGGGGPAVIDAVSRDDDVPRFLALSVSDAPEDVIATVRAGARGYVTKTITTGELGDAIEAVARGEAVFPPRLAGLVLDAFAGGAGEPAESSEDELDRLTAREREVMRLIARGYAYKQIARQLEISGKTVETHVSAVLRKLQLASRHELTRWAAERRLL